MLQPKVSVCIDVYNYADFLPDAIESVLGQTLSDIEVIVVDDCSADGSYEIALDYARQDERVRAERNPANRGMIGNRNACLRLANGEYVKFLHADDFLCSPEALHKMLARIEANPAVSLAACAMQFVREDKQAAGRSPAVFSDDRYFSGTTVITRCLMEQKNLIGGPSAALFRRDRALRGFDEQYFHAADLEMWFHLLEQGCFGYIDEPLVGYRWHPRQQTEKDRNSLSQANDQRAMLAGYLNKPYVRLRGWLKAYLQHDAIRQTLRRGRKIGQQDASQKVLQAYGAGRYLKNYPLNMAWRAVRKHAGFVYDQAAPCARPGLAANQTPDYPEGINVAGFLKGQYGIGESSRAFGRAVSETGIPTALVNIDSRDHSNQDATVKQFSSANPYGVNLMTFSFDYTRRFYRDHGVRFFEGRHNIALWYWELQDFPPRWHSNFDYNDEIWVPTEFCRQAFAGVSPVPVHKITYPLYSDTSAVRDRGAFSLSEHAYVFLFNFDFLSTPARKNPLGVISAFARAFDPDENVTLVLKTINSDQDPLARVQIAEAVCGLNVVLIESHLAGARMASLFASCDCYVSLHRSEGLGLGMAQAMALGKPVIATGYSGNLEYMNAGNSLLVKYKIAEICEDCGPCGRPPVYPKGSVWADPDIADAARWMRWVYEHQDEAQALGARGRTEITSTLDPEKTRAEIRQRIQHIYRHQ